MADDSSAVEGEPAPSIPTQPAAPANGQATPGEPPQSQPAAAGPATSVNQAGGFSTAPRTPGLPPRWATGRRDLTAFDGLGLAARFARLAVVVILLVGAVLVAYATVTGVGPPSKDDLIKQSGLLDKQQLLIGVKDDQPGLAYRTPSTGEYSGFDVNIALMVAAELGFGKDDVKFLTIESEDRARRQAQDPKTKKFVTVDLVVATFSITAAREKDPDVLFSAPYLRTEQSVLTRKGAGVIEALTDLAGEKVCTLNSTTSMAALQNAGVKPVGRNKISECVDLLRQGKIYAVSTDADILAGFEYEYHGSLQMHDIGLEESEDYGINVGPNPALRTLVNLALYKSLTDPADRRWEDAYEQYLRPEQADSLPQQVAVDRQPTVAKPKVRVWPWAD